MKKLEDLRPGDWVRWNSRDWEVTDRDVYKGSSDYSEIQWELSADGGGERYLLLSRENKEGRTEEAWICTEQTSVGSVEYAAGAGDWRAFQDQDSLPEAPAAVRLGGVDFTFDGESRGPAEDDEGNTVVKLTWDYYDKSRRRNLAIEIWKEPDADYYEAYDGLVVRPAEFNFLPPRPRRGAKLSEVAGHLVAIAFASLFIIPIAGGVLNVFDVGAEYLLAAMIPGLLIYIAYMRGAHPGLLATALPAACAAGVLAVKFRGLGGPYWEYALYGLLAGPALAEAASRFFPASRWSDKPAAAGGATLLFLNIISFSHYAGYAPHPHNMSGLLAACALPLLPALAVYLFYRLKGDPDGNAQA
ncbi:MAG: hypothetical protein A2X31_00590 [Elusimicrobia bacterium GWB2_63_22]|nr:MAG: hypothetical protein A2X31_00590 [Elusimicrobia bacterium GWB2_63_22]